MRLKAAKLTCQPSAKQQIAGQALRESCGYLGASQYHATSSTAASSRYCCPHATSTPASYPPRRSRAGSIRGSFIRTALAWVVSEVNKITPDGLPVLLIENAPPEIKSFGFRLTRPDLLRRNQDPVFVHTAREEFDYPCGDQNKYSTYQAFGGSVWESNPPFDPLRTESPALKAGEITGPLSPPEKYSWKW